MGGCPEFPLKPQTSKLRTSVVGVHAQIGVSQNRGSPLGMFVFGKPGESTMYCLFLSWAGVPCFETNPSGFPTMAVGVSRKAHTHTHTSELLTGVTEFPFQKSQLAAGFQHNCHGRCNKNQFGEYTTDSSSLFLAARIWLFLPCLDRFDKGPPCLRLRDSNRKHWRVLNESA